MSLPTEPGSLPTSACRACGQALPVGKTVCPACGAAHGEGNRCPHCQAIADVEPHPALGFVCRVCGGPRLALDGVSLPPSEATQRALSDAKQEHRAHLWLTAAAGFAGAGAALWLLVVLVLALVSPGWLPALLALAAAVPGGGALLALQRAAKARDRRKDALHAAQLSALSDLQRSGAPQDAARVAQIFRLSPDQAELLLAEASVAAMLAPMPEPRLRVEPAPTVLSEPELDAEPAPATVQQRGQTEIPE